MALVETVLIGSLGDANVAAAAAVALLNPLGIQLDAAIAFFLGPLQAELALALSVAIDIQIALDLGISISLAAQLDAAIALVASLSAGIGISASASISADASIAAALSLRLGLLNVLLEAMIAVKIPAMRAAAEFAAALSGPDIAVLVWNGTDPAAPLTLSDAGAQIKNMFDAGITLGPLNGPQAADNTLGVIIVGSAPSLGASFGVIFADPTGIFIP